ncbi:hypothetical protein [Staphylococcus debuckii]|uniref:hypothetical protein n=1 Tax=Staphylococcus debuckii TaxID=2044912 RepID=UPI000F42F3A8|nr:hypothetical protein [Staphylococcus debuckii]AYU54493.1 hypothetical protein CNQ82_03245 [Staphylococcus debuckii]
MKRFLTYSAAVARLSLILTGCSGQSDKKTSDAKAQTTQHDSKQASNNKVTEIKIDKAKLSDKAHEKMKKEVLDWADKYGKQQGLAVSNRYFGAGEISSGDWYAMTPKGELQVSNQGSPGPKAFDRHNLVGVVMYKAKDHTTGFDTKAKDLTNIESYQNVADLNQPVTKYLFADDGKVYEYTFQPEEKVKLSSGFAPKDHNDKDPNLKPDHSFKISDNSSANQEMQRLIKEYSNQSK